MFKGQKGGTGEGFAIRIRKKKRAEEICKKRMKNENSLDDLQTDLLLRGINVAEENDLGKILALVNLLKKHDEQENEKTEKVQIRVLGLLINLAYHRTEFSEDLVKNQLYFIASRFFIKVQSDLCKDSIWLLTNIMIGNENIRKKLACFGFIDALIELLRFPNLRNDTKLVVFWALSSLAENISKTSNENLVFLVKLLADLLPENLIENSRSEVFNIFSNILSVKQEFVDLFFDWKICDYIIDNLNLFRGKETYCMIKVIGHVLFITGDSHCSKLLEMNLLNPLFNLLFSDLPKVRSEAFICFSNIASCSYEIKSILLNEKIITTASESLFDNTQIVSEESAIFLRILSTGLFEQDYILIYKTGIIHKILYQKDELISRPSFPTVLVFLSNVFRNLAEVDQELLESLSDLQSDMHFAEHVSLILKKFQEKSISLSRPSSFNI